MYNTKNGCQRISARTRFEAYSTVHSLTPRRWRLICDRGKPRSVVSPPNGLVNLYRGRGVPQSGRCFVKLMVHLEDWNSTRLGLPLFRFSGNGISNFTLFLRHYALLRAMRSSLDGEGELSYALSSSQNGTPTLRTGQQLNESDQDR
jgi:hypothetical protein